VPETHQNFQKREKLSHNPAGNYGKSRLSTPSQLCIIRINNTPMGAQISDKTSQEFLPGLRFKNGVRLDEFPIKLPSRKMMFTPHFFVASEIV
jgi:hypothetical protein